MTLQSLAFLSLASLSICTSLCWGGIIQKSAYGAIKPYYLRAHPYSNLSLKFCLIKSALKSYSITSHRGISLDYKCIHPSLILDPYCWNSAESSGKYRVVSVYVFSCRRRLNVLQVMGDFHLFILFFSGVFMSWS